MFVVGGRYGLNVSEYPASFRGYEDINRCNDLVGFRITFYL